ncbi:MAG: phosphoglycerate dehydrogenase [Desulfotomaculales bacterium]
MKVLVTDNVAREGIAVLAREPDIEVHVRDKLDEGELAAIIGEYDALIIRSATKVTARVIENAQRLKIIARAGVGVDNIDVDAATRKGIMVVNAPNGNTVAATEHTMAMMLALARNIPQANSRLKAGIWDRQSFIGVELRGKTLGIIGLGRIGSGVARRARAMEMRVLAYDPYIREEQAASLGVELVALETLLRQSDFITVHIPLTKESRHLLNERAFGMMKDGVRIVNCARGGIIDEKALYRALVSGKVAGAALDVFEVEPAVDNPLFQLDNVIVTPHLGASTREAQAGVAADVAAEVLAALRGEVVRNAVNIPAIDPATLARLRPYLELAEKLGRFQAQILTGRTQKVEVVYSGEIAREDVTLVTTAVLKGLLDPILQAKVNFVNAPLVAKERGIQVVQIKEDREETGWASLITVRTHTSEGEHMVGGTLFYGNEPRIVLIDGYRVDTIPSGHMLVIPHTDKPRIIGRVGTLLGQQDINIAFMQVGRKVIGGRAIMVLSVDSPVPEETLAEIAKGDGIFDVKQVTL